MNLHLWAREGQIRCIPVIIGEVRGDCCPPMDLFGSEAMQLVQLIFPIESAHLTVSYLGDLGLLHFKDVCTLCFAASSIFHFICCSIVPCDILFRVFVLCTHLCFSTQLSFPELHFSILKGEPSWFYIIIYSYVYRLIVLIFF